MTMRTEADDSANVARATNAATAANTANNANNANNANVASAASVASEERRQDSPSRDRVSAGSALLTDSGIPTREVAIVVPCFNESAVIDSTLARLREWFPEALLVVIDDGSADDTGERARAAARVDSRILVSRQPANGGKGRAVAAAAPFTVGHAVVIADADLAYEQAPIQRAIDALATADVAIGSRRHPQSTYVVPVRLFGFLYRRHVMGHLFNLVVRVALGLDMRDTQCGLKAFRAQAFADIMSRLRTAGFAFDLDVLLLARGLGLRINEVPVDVTMTTGRSSVRLVRDGLIAIKEVALLARRRFTGGYSRASLR